MHSVVSASPAIDDACCSAVRITLQQRQQLRQAGDPLLVDQHGAAGDADGLGQTIDAGQQLRLRLVPEDNLFRWHDGPEDE